MQLIADLLRRLLFTVVQLKKNIIVASQLYDVADEGYSSR